jgi:hypothetical protein
MAGFGWECTKITNFTRYLGVLNEVSFQNYLHNPAQNCETNLMSSLTT